LAEVSEFKGVRYNPEKVQRMADVICPPYDVISPQEQEALYERNPYNMVRLEYGQTMPGDDAGNNRYTRSRQFFDQWLKEGYLKQDSVSSYYVHEHVFEIGEMKRRRLELYACVRLEAWDSGVVFPHEFTMEGAKADRLDLMKACATNFSPILGLYEDPGGRVNQLIANRVKTNPVYSFQNADSHRFWMVNEPEFVQRMSYFLVTKSIYIADGHHRYETALAYRNYRRKLDPGAGSNASFNYVLMALVSFSDPGIIILPIHRLVRGIDPETLKRFNKDLSQYFQVSDGRYMSGIRIYGLEPGQVMGLSLLPKIKVNDFLEKKRSEPYGKLDVSIVQHIICEKLLGLPAGDTDKLAYTPSGEAACRLVDEGQYQFAVLLDPVSPVTIKNIADARDRMPRKSTYFYPKLPSGLVIHRLDGEI